MEATLLISRLSEKNIALGDTPLLSKPLVATEILKPSEWKSS